MTDLPSPRRGPWLPMRLRKFIGTIVLTILVIVYSLIAMAIGGRVIEHTEWWVHLLFFVVSGFVWIIPSMGVIWWMTRPDRPKQG